MASDILNSEEHSVSTSLEIAQTYHMVNDIFNTRNNNLADLYTAWKRCLIIVDLSVFDLYGSQMRNYFDIYGIAATIHSTRMTEDRKNVETLLEVCSWITEFDLLRREPVLVVGGGLVTDIAGSDLPWALVDEYG